MLFNVLIFVLGARILVRAVPGMQAPIVSCSAYSNASTVSNGIQPGTYQIGVLAAPGLLRTFGRGAEVRVEDPFTSPAPLAHWTVEPTSVPAQYKLISGFLGFHAFAGLRGRVITVPHDSQDGSNVFTITPARDGTFTIGVAGTDSVLYALDFPNPPVGFRAPRGTRAESWTFVPVSKYYAKD